MLHSAPTPLFRISQLQDVIAIATRTLNLALISGTLTSISGLALASAIRLLLLAQDKHPSLTTPLAPVTVTRVQQYVLNFLLPLISINTHVLATATNLLPLLLQHFQCLIHKTAQ